jgi:hypothetical protein
MTLYDPERWLETTIRGIKDYVIANINTRIYDVRMEFPAPSLERGKVPLSKTIIHFEIDDMPERHLGFGENIGAYNYDAAAKLAFPQEARVQEVNFDVGIWAWDKSGGTTSRMKAKQILSNLFGGPLGQRALFAATDGGDGGVEILSFSGGRYAIDRINDVRVYRMVNCALDVRVFSRTPMPSEGGPTIEDIQQAPNLSIIG